MSDPQQDIFSLNIEENMEAFKRSVLIQERVRIRLQLMDWIVQMQNQSRLPEAGALLAALDLVDGDDPSRWGFELSTKTPDEIITDLKAHTGTS